MAPNGESCYLPPLDRCLDGRHQLLSWKTTFIGLTQSARRTDDAALERHLTDAQTVELLSRPFSPYSAPTSKTKASFETKTSAINVSPSSHGRYDIKQIKDDALWLSKKTEIDEIAALRITVLEWQTRPANRLLMTDAYGDYQDHLNTVGINGLNSSVLKSDSTFGTGQLPPKEDVEFFEDVQGRHQRLLQIYLSERQYLIKTCEFIISVASFETFPDLPDDNSDQPKGQSLNMPGWLAGVGDQVLVAWNLEGLAHNRDKHFTVDAINALRIRCQVLSGGSSWLPDEPYREQMDQAWAKNNFLEIIHIMQLLFTLLASSTDLIRSDTVLAWFRLMQEYAFFNNHELSIFSPEDTYNLTLESLVALISLAVLKLPSTVENIVQMSIGTSPNGVSVPYLRDVAGIRETNAILVEAAAACLTNASPAVLAWSIILQTMRECFLAYKESGKAGKIGAAGKYAMKGPPGSDTLETWLQPGSADSQDLSTSTETSQYSNLLEKVLDNLMDAEPAEDPIKDLARSALDGSGVFPFITALAIDYCSIFAPDHQGTLGLVTRRILLDLVRATLDWIDYQPTLINAVLGILTGNLSYWDILDRPPGLKAIEPAVYFLSDTSLMQKLFYTALARFPYESLPFLQIFKALALSEGKSDEGLPELFLLMQNVDSLTSIMPPGFSAYEIVQGDEDSNLIRLASNLDLFDDHLNLSLHAGGPSAASRMLATPTSVWDSQQLPSGTEGCVISESKPLIVMWRYRFSPLKYLGRILQSASMNGNFSAGSSDVVSETIDLLSTMMSANGQHDSGRRKYNMHQEAARQILEHASDGLDRNQDIVSVVFQIFENELYRHQKVSGDEPSLDILLRCVQFMHALLSVMPDRVWPFLARSSLLGVGSVENQFNTLVASSEFIPGYYSFLFGCVRLFDALIEDTIRRTASQRIASTATTRFVQSDIQESAVSRIMIGKVLYNYQQMMMNLLEGQQSWKLISNWERFKINHWICSAFVKILNFCYAIDDQVDSSQKIAGPLISAGNCLVDAFRSAFNGSFKIHALLQMLFEGMASADTSLSIRGMQYLNSQTISTISLMTALIRVNKLLGRAPQPLDEDIFKVSPILVKLYATNEEVRLPIVDLFEAVISSAASVEQQPPSLLGHLGEVTARSFLEMLSTMDQPFKNDELSIGIWRLLSTIVSQRQRWFAIFVLTGNTPRQSFKENKKDTAPNATVIHPTEPLLAVGLDELSNLEKLTPSVTIAILEFMALAADYWPWVLNTMEEHPHFLGAIREYLAVGEENLQDRAQKTSRDYFRLRISSLIVNILAMFICYTQKVGDSASAKKFIPDIRYLSEVAIAVPSYNTSLHGFLRRNFELKFSGLQISQFKRSSLKRPMLGSSFYYDMELAADVLSFDPFWTGRRRGRGFADELLRANINLSLVESQVNLFHAWKFISVELSQPLGSDAVYQQVMISTVIACLRSNVSSKLPENIFQGLALSRGELAFSLLQRLFEVRSTQNELEDVLSAAWDALRDYEGDFGLALSGADADYYRILLKILSLSLQTYLLVSSSQRRRRQGTESDGMDALPKNMPSAAAIQTAVEIFGIVVTQGFRSLTTLLHDDPAWLLPADFALIIAISRAILHMPGIGNHVAQLLSHFSDNQTTLHASALLSWSDQITTDHDPVYAELSISFLLSLSDMPSLAECLAVEGLLTHLSSTNLISFLRQKTGIGPFDNPARLYSIWYRGVLPLLLNLLIAVGAPIASEIACTLNSFPSQLSRASNTFRSKPISSKDPTAGSITLSMATETQNLAMIRKILKSFREAGPSAGVEADQIVELTWDQARVKDDIEHWMQRRAALRSRIMPTTEKEKTWAWLPPLSTTTDAENRLEEKMLEEMKAILSLLDDNDQ